MPPAAWQVLWRAHALGLSPAASRSIVLLGVPNDTECRILSALTKHWAPRFNSPHRDNQIYGPSVSPCESTESAKCSASGRDEGAAENGDGSGGQTCCQPGRLIRDHHLLSNTATAISAFAIFQADFGAQQLTHNRDGHHTPISISTVENRRLSDTVARSAALSQRGFSSGRAHGSKGNAECWSCGSAQGAAILFFCNQCGAIQPASDTANYFQLLGV